MIVSNKNASFIINALSNINNDSLNNLEKQNYLIQEMGKNTKILSKEFLEISSLLYKKGLIDIANRISQNVIEGLLEPSYDAESAFNLHKTMFPERHIMAEFLNQNLLIIKNEVLIKNQKKIDDPQDKIKIFTYWHSEDNLPPIVQLCRENLKKYISNNKFDLILLNEKNYKDWLGSDELDFPDNISQAHFSDIMRMRLLDKWGGFWLDATCLLTKDFFEATKEIRKESQFYFTYTGSRVGSWFIWSQKNNYITGMINESLKLWHNKECYLTNYFMLHDIIEMLYWVDKNYQIQWNKMKKLHPKKSLNILNSYNYNKEDSEKILNDLLKDAFVHKLTYKYDVNKILKGSILDSLLKYQFV